MQILLKHDIPNIKQLATMHESLAGQDNITVDAGEIVFSKTANRSLVAKMNNAIKEIQMMQEYLGENTRIQRYISIITGRFIQRSPYTDKGFYPIDQMIECLDIYRGRDDFGNSEDVLDVDLYQLKVKIHIEGYDIWRRMKIAGLKYTSLDKKTIVDILFEYLQDEQNIGRIWSSLSPFEKEYNVLS